MNTSEQQKYYHPFCGVTAVRRNWMREQAEAKRVAEDARRVKLVAKVQKRKEKELHELLSDASSFHEWREDADQAIVHFLNGKYGCDCRKSAQRWLARQPFMGTSQVRTTEHSLMLSLRFSGTTQRAYEIRAKPRRKRRHLFFFGCGQSIAALPR